MGVGRVKNRAASVNALKTKAKPSTTRWLKWPALSNGGPCFKDILRWFRPFSLGGSALAAVVITSLVFIDLARGAKGRVTETALTRRCSGEKR
jgi:hypothetical protein